MRFNVSYEIVTQESAEHGDAAENGFIAESVSLREAIDSVFETRTSRVDGVTAIEPNDSDLRRASWISVYNGMEFETGAHESRSIHLPKNLTGSSRARIARLMRAA
jgi:hypothetical protein